MRAGGVKAANAALLEGDDGCLWASLYYHRMRVSPLAPVELRGVEPKILTRTTHTRAQPQDPSSGTEVVYMELSDVTKEVEQENLVKEARRQEHAILQSMIPEHIIDFLVEEKRSKRREAEGSSRGRWPMSSTRSSTGSLGSSEEGLLSLTGVQAFNESRVASLAEEHRGVTVLFTDVVGFTEMTSQCAPTDIMLMLNNLFTMFDERSDEHHIYKVETIGDAYMCAAGLNLKSERKKIEGSANTHRSAKTRAASHAKRMLSFAQDILEGVKEFTTPTGEPLRIRVGMHTGDCMSGVVGIKMPRFCLFGDTVNTASRMESNGVVGKIHVSKATRDWLPDEPWEATGGIEAKGKGVLETFVL